MLLDKFRRLVIVRYTDEASREMPYEKDAQDKTRRESVRNTWSIVRYRRPNATLKPLYTSDIPTSKPTRRRFDPAGKNDTLPIIDPKAFYAIEVDDDDKQPHELVNEVKGAPDTVTADTYLMAEPCPPPFSPDDDRLYRNQGYLSAAPLGIDMAYVQQFEGGDGGGIGLIDIERGWTLNHEDLIAAKIRLLSGVNKDYFGHGTAVLGQLSAQDNTMGVIGIARGCKVNVVSQWQTNDDFRTDLAILEAVKHLQAGDVLLLEAQIMQNGVYYPVEVEPHVRNAIRIAYNAGIIVIEAAGNGSANLDTYPGNVLRRGHKDFQESGAILVGAGGAGAVHRRMPFSNYGSRIDCYGWGENIVTTGDGEQGNQPHVYTNRFTGTSGAAPMIAGIAVLVQAVRLKNELGALWPKAMRQLLTDPANGTPSASPGTDQIGVMPDLRKILTRMFHP